MGRWLADGLPLSMGLECGWGVFGVSLVLGRAKKARQAVWDDGARNDGSTVEGRWKPRLLDPALLLVLRRVRKRRGIGSAAGETVPAAFRPIQAAKGRGDGETLPREAELG